MINLSKKPFYATEYKVLNKNLNFVPTPGKPNQRDFKNDVDKYLRRVVLRAHFGADNKEIRKPDGLAPNSNSNWLPKRIHHTVQTYMQAVSNDLTQSVVLGIPA